MKSLWAGLLFLAATAAPVFAQNETLVAEGVAGDADASGRSPVLSVRTEVGTLGVKILADAHVSNSVYKQYPLRFDFYVNRKLFASQIRSPELPGPVGVDIGADVAVPPFNYVVVVQMVHPNRMFSSVIQGAVFSTNLTGTYDCTLTLVAGEETSIFVANQVQTYQAGNEAFSLSFEGRSEDGESQAAVTGVVFVSGTSASSTLKIVRNDVSDTEATTGTAEVADGKVISFTLNSADGNTKLSCS